MCYRILLTFLVMTFGLTSQANAWRRGDVFTPRVLAASPSSSTTTGTNNPDAGSRKTPPASPAKAPAAPPPIPEGKPVGIEVTYKLHYDYWRNNLRTTENGAVWTHALNISFRINPLNMTINFSTNYLNIFYNDVGKKIYFSSWTDSALSFSWEQTVLTLFTVDWRLSLGLEFNIPTGGTRLSRDKARAIPNSSVVTADNKGSGFNAGVSASLTTEPIPNLLTTSVSGRFVYTSPYLPNRTGDPDTDRTVDETYTFAGGISLGLVP
ncbi:MAG: hypothetical protein KJ621_06985, partial [Proteobacteria bacterium]|nr:hypothetical protein [Pseudomonadota bacterium]MBU1740017.1 hypothetical protein [Pseudomonadota bacterium]